MNKEKIVIIEDNEDLRENLQEILELSGYEVRSAENGKLGLKLLQSYIPDLIICDVMMPELDGYGVLKILNNDIQLAQVPFMFLTAKAQKEDLRKGMGLGAVDYITKPFDDAELLQAIEIRLKKSNRLSSIEDSGEQGLKKLYSEAKALKEFERLSEDHEIKTYDARTVIYKENEHPHWLYYVVSGQVKTVRTNEFGKELILDIWKEGDFFGYLPLLMNSTYTQRAITTADSKIKVIPKDDFNLLLFNNRDFAVKFIKMMASDEEKKRVNLLNLAYSSVRRRVASALLVLFENIEEGERMQIKRDDIAAIAGTAKETTIRTLSEFNREGIVTVTKNYLAILNKKVLQEIPQ